MKISIQLTEAQLVWLYRLLSLGMDSYFQNNIRERKHCDNISDILRNKMKEIGYDI